MATPEQVSESGAGDIEACEPGTDKPPYPILPLLHEIELLAAKSDVLAKLYQQGIKCGETKTVFWLERLHIAVHTGAIEALIHMFAEDDAAVLRSLRRGALPQATAVSRNWFGEWTIFLRDGNWLTISPGAEVGALRSPEAWAHRPANIMLVAIDTPAAAEKWREVLEGAPAATTVRH